MAEYRFFWIEYFGDFNIDLLETIYVEGISHPDNFSGINELHDFSNSTMEGFTAEDVGRLRTFIEVRPNLHGLRRVLVVNSALEHLIAQTIGSVLEKTIPADRHYCYSVSEAIEWLQPEKADKIIAKLKFERS